MKEIVYIDLKVLGFIGLLPQHKPFSPLPSNLPFQLTLLCICNIELTLFINFIIQYSFIKFGGSWHHSFLDSELYF